MFPKPGLISINISLHFCAFLIFSWLSLTMFFAVSFSFSDHHFVLIIFTYFFLIHSLFNVTIPQSILNFLTNVTQHTSVAVCNIIPFNYFQTAITFLQCPLSILSVGRQTYFEQLFMTYGSLLVWIFHPFNYLPFSHDPCS